jgi:hypothetical protein
VNLSAEWFGRMLSRCVEFVRRSYITKSYAQTAPVYIVVAALVLPMHVRAQTVAKALVVTGPTQVMRAALPPRPLRTRSEFLLGDRVQVGAQGSVLVVFYRKGVRYRLLAGSTYRIQAASVARLTGQPPQQLAALPSALVGAARMVLQSEPPQFLGTVVRSDDAQGPRHPLPVGGVRTRIVTLRWEGPIIGVGGERLSLRLQITEVAGSRTILERTLSQDARSFLVPAHLLIPGRWYTWSVLAVGPNRTCGGPIRLIGPAERSLLARVEQADQTMHTSTEEDAETDRLLAEVYERLGLFAQALEDYELVLRQHSDDADAQAAVKRLSDLVNIP